MGENTAYYIIKMGFKRYKVSKLGGKLINVRDYCDMWYFRMGEDSGLK
jgi:hypothetical protein